MPKSGVKRTEPMLLSKASDLANSPVGPSVGPRQVAAAFPAFDTAPTQLHRRSQLADLIRWHALRRGEDFWNIQRNSAETYGLTTAQTYLEVAGALSPVPGGVGPVTVTMLLRNTVEAARKQLARRT